MSIEAFAVPPVIGIAAVFIFTLEGIFPHYKGRTHRLRHAMPHIACALINAALTWAVFAWFAHLATGYETGLLNIFDVPATIKVALAVVMFDLYMYYWHMANHRVGFLWRFHRAHHSDTEMDTTTALRFHPGELALSGIFRLPVVAAIGMDIRTLLLFELALNLSILFHHSNLALPPSLDRALRYLIATPEMHRVHHSILASENGSNFTSLLSIWDRIHRTFRLRPDTRAITLGLSVFREPRWQGLSGLLITPIEKQ